MTDIRVDIRCLNGEAPVEINVDAMLVQLNAYKTRKYGNWSVRKEYQEWKPFAFTDDMYFSIVWELEECVEMPPKAQSSVGINEIDLINNCYAKEIWNAAIEAVLKLDRVDEYAAIEIRKLKK